MPWQPQSQRGIVFWSPKHALVWLTAVVPGQLPRQLIAQQKMSGHEIAKPLCDRMALHWEWTHWLRCANIILRMD